MENEQGTSEDGYDHVIERLRAFGSAPLADDIGKGAFGRARGRQARASAGRAKWVVAATVAGFVAGSVGLAAADVLPAPVQDVAHHALDTVGVHVPPGHQRFNDPATCPGGPYANHGAYVRTHHDDPNAGQSPCGKPIHAVEPGNGSTADHDEKGQNGNGKKSHDPHPGKGKGKGKGHGNGNGDGEGDGLKPHGDSDEKPDTNSEQPAAHGPSTSIPALTTTTTAATTTVPTTTTMPTTTTSAPPSPTT
jgi:hypothetical protein